MRVALLAAALLVAAVGLPSPGQAGASIAHPRERVLLADRPDSSEVQRFEFGFLLGTPSEANLEWGWWTDPRWGFRVSGMYFGVAGSGVQANLCRTLQRARRTRSSLALVAGTMHVHPDSWNYAGAAVDLNLSSLFLEAGFIYWSGTDRFREHRSGPGLVIQLGIMNGGGLRGPR